MPKKETTKIKTAFSIDIEVNNKLEKILKRSGEKKSTYVNNILRAAILKKHFKTAHQLLKEKKR